jgi:hypothetical protein
LVCNTFFILSLPKQHKALAESFEISNEYDAGLLV